MKTKDGYTIGYAIIKGVNTRDIRIKWNVISIVKDDYELLIHLKHVPMKFSNDTTTEFDHIKQMHEDGMTFEEIKDYYEL